MNKKVMLIILFSCLTNMVWSQSHLSKKINIKLQKQPIKDALTIISNDGDFNFSYNAKAVNKDSLISIDVKNKTVLEALRLMFDASYDFKESGSYVIIRRKAISTSNIIAKAPVQTDHFFITGYVIDEESGDKLQDATIYEKNNLISTMTDEKGAFSLKLKNKYNTASISISKSDYYDTTVIVKSNFNQKLTIAISKKEPAFVALPQPDDTSFDTEQFVKNTTENQFLKIEKRWFTNFFISSKQKIRSLNLKRFYTTRAYQFSLVPGLSTHGRMNPQVINGISINLLGGYSGGTSKFEVGGLFNIDKNDVKHCQIAGLFNLVGGKMKGVQIASLYNETNDSVKGIQLSGLVNVAKDEVEGFQIATLYNKAKRINGLQIGFINVTEGTEGTSIGFVNISKGKRHKHRVSFIARLPRKS